MPQRPRAHQLEEESRRAFERALPAAWVHRRLDPDYGLDYTVEIFEEGRATGLSFHAQLKATDAPTLERALVSVRFRVDLADFYRSLAEPVLIVLYHAPTGRLFARWFHARQASYVLTTGSVHRAPRRSLSFRFEEADEWRERTPEEVAAGVRAFRTFRSPDLPVPLRLAVEMTGERAHGRTAIEHALGLRRVLAAAADVVHVEVGSAGPGDIALTLGPEALLVRLGDVASLSGNLEEKSSSEELEVLYADIGLAVAALLAIVGQLNLASTLAVATAPSSKLIGEPELAFLLAGAMYRARRVLEALTLANQLDERGDEDVEREASRWP